MTADNNVYRLGKLCNSGLAGRREAVRWLRGRAYQADLRVARLTSAWPDEDRRTSAQQGAIKQAQLFAASCHAALDHHQQLLAKAMGEPDEDDIAQAGIHPSEWSS